VRHYGLIKKYLDKQGRGLEIGPSHCPIAPKRDGYNVQILDHTDQSGLLEKYKGHGVNLENIEEVDFVWNGEKYCELTGHSNYYDWVVASHVAEHAPDLISFINECAAIVNDAGVIILAIPDATHCFDYFRQLSSISEIIDAHQNSNKFHTIGTAVDNMLNACKMNNAIAWDAKTGGTLEFMHSLADAKKLLAQQSDLAAYQDYHAWCFTPHSFRVLMEDLYALGLTAVREVAFIPTGGFEFFMVLGRTGAGPKQGRLQMMKKMKRELAQDMTMIERLNAILLRLRCRLAK